MKAIQRHFLGWDTPFLPEVAKWLQEHYLDGELSSSSNVLILVSGQEVARRLQSTLVGNASEKGKGIVLPAIETTSQCLDRFLDSSIRFADPITSEIATASVLRGMDQDDPVPRCTPPSNSPPSGEGRALENNVQRQGCVP